MDCKTFSHIDESGVKVYKFKRKFNSLNEAIARCKDLNARPTQLTKLVSYKCMVCHYYHIGRNGKPITDKYKTKLVQSKPSHKFKILGKINLK